ncbi:phage tail protein [Pseudocitrobacter sp. RIT415]|uniref:phage tail protein n=1 Tax=Pseudocitrobacter sp. RIT415 TaxID=2202163 RepID=UPI000D3518BC|nr:phage tail protein [Pseudocitrobacter sp. RIT 415]RAU45271.1 phage tail protein [Pseudocitrobacter sp. RIT 415]
MNVSDQLSKVKLLDYYYQRRAESSIGIGERFELTSAVFGTSNLVTNNPTGIYDIADIPADFELSDLTSQVATSTSEDDPSGNSNKKFTPSYDSGIITLRAELDSSKLEENVSYPFNTLVVCDNLGKACLVMCCQQDSLYLGKSYVTVTDINTMVG